MSREPRTSPILTTATYRHEGDAVRVHRNQGVRAPDGTTWVVTRLSASTVTVAHPEPNGDWERRELPGAALVRSWIPLTSRDGTPRWRY